MRKELTQEELKDIFMGEEVEGWTVVDNLPWKDGGKYQFKSLILQEQATGKHYEAVIYRSGSAFTDYNYEYPISVVEVVKAEKTITYWKKA